MSVEIAYTLIPDTTSLLFFVASGASSHFNACFNWYLNDVLVSTDNTYTLVSPNDGDQVYAIVQDYSASGCTTYWHDGQFYGGLFTGNFSGGTFHYGTLNCTQYTKQPLKPKYFFHTLPKNY